MISADLLVWVPGLGSGSPPMRPETQLAHCIVLIPMDFWFRWCSNAWIVHWYMLYTAQYSLIIIFNHCSLTILEICACIASSFLATHLWLYCCLPLVRMPCSCLSCFSAVFNTAHPASQYFFLIHMYADPTHSM